MKQQGEEHNEQGKFIRDNSFNGGIHIHRGLRNKGVRPEQRSAH
jgi:hypothetical protein